MNALGIFILAALLLRFVLELAADLLQKGALSRDPDSSVAHLYSSETLSKARSYLMERNSVKVIESFLDLVALLLFWFLGGFAWLDRFCRGLEWGSIAEGLVFVSVLVVLQGVLSLPFQIWRTCQGVTSA